MGKTQKRGGAKAHRKRVAKRNNEIKVVKNAYQKLFDEAMKTQIEELKKQHLSGETENTEMGEESTNGI